MTTLNKYLKHMEIDSTRRLPSDIYKLAEETYYSESRDEEIKKGDMDLFHLIRALIKNSNEKNHCGNRRSRFCRFKPNFKIIKNIKF